MAKFLIALKAAKEAHKIRVERFVWTDEEAAAIFGAVAQKRVTEHYPKGDKRGGQFKPKDDASHQPLEEKEKEPGVHGPRGYTGETGEKVRDEDLMTDREGNKTFVVRTSEGIDYAMRTDDTIAKHVLRNDDGTYRLSPERQALHDKVVSDYLKDVPVAVGQPQVYMMGGGTAAGKSTMLNGALSGKDGSPRQVPHAPDPRAPDAYKGGRPEAVLIDPDALKATLPEYRDMLKGRNYRAAAYAHEESSMLGKRLQAAAIATKRHVVLDTTGDSDVDKLAGQLKQFQDGKYRINAFYATNHTNRALGFAKKRALQTGRYVPDNVVREVHANVSRTFEAAVKARLYDRVVLYDTNKKNNARLIGQGNRNGFTVHNRGLWNQFRRKGHSGKATINADGTKKKADRVQRKESDIVDTHTCERILVDIVAGVAKERSTVGKLTAAQSAFWDRVAEELKNAPKDAVIDIGSREYPERDYSSLYEGDWAPPEDWAETAEKNTFDPDAFDEVTEDAREADNLDEVNAELDAAGDDAPTGDEEEEAAAPDEEEDETDAPKPKRKKSATVHPGAHDGEGVVHHQWVTAKRFDNEKQIVYGEVYAPNQLDTFGEFMTAEDIEVMAHRFMQLDMRTVIDTQHDNIPNGAYPVESFIARENDEDYTPGAWVLGVKVPDQHLWQAVKKGELNGFSFQSLVKPTSVEVQYTSIRDHVGQTEQQDDHYHVFFAELDEIGNVTGGRTSKAADGHFHEISRASTTDWSAGHSHRFFL
jgi:hypothetical protein